MDLEDEKQRAESDFFEYVATSYRCFLAGDDQQCELLHLAFEVGLPLLKLQLQHLLVALHQRATVLSLTGL